MYVAIATRGPGVGELGVQTLKLLMGDPVGREAQLGGDRWTLRREGRMDWRSCCEPRTSPVGAGKVEGRHLWDQGVMEYWI